MKKKIALCLIGVTLGGLLVGCGKNNQNLINNVTYTKAIIIFGENELEVELKSWGIMSDSNIVVETTDGKYYASSANNILLIGE